MRLTRIYQALKILIVFIPLASVIFLFENCSSGMNSASQNSAASVSPSPSPKPSPSPTPSSGLPFQNIGACTNSSAPTNGTAIFAGNGLPQNWGAYAFSGSTQPNTADISIACSPGHKVISYVTSTDQFVGMVVTYNGGTGGFLPVTGVHYVSFDIYVSVANTIVAVTAPYLGEPNDHPWLINTQGIVGAAPNPQAIAYPLGWSHMEFAVPAKPAGNDNVAAVTFEKWTTGVVTIAIDNLYFY